MSSEYHDEQTLFKVHDAMVKSGLSVEQALNTLREMQNAGILFRELQSEKVKDERPHSKACGFRMHEHGSQCSSSCPTCHGYLSIG